MAVNAPFLFRANNVAETLYFCPRTPQTRQISTNLLTNTRMATHRTFSMIKPDAYQGGHSGAILQMIEKAGFRLVALKLTHLTADTAGKFYEVHRERPFYADLVKYMSSGPIIALILEKENAVADFRKLIGATNPAQAEEGTIRKLYAQSIEANAVHGSDSDENAALEGQFFFATTEQF